MGATKQKRKNPYDSWDPLTQAKYIYDLKVQLGKLNILKYKIFNLTTQSTQKITS